MSSAPVVAFHDVSKRYGATLAVDGVSFEIARGECVSLLGPSGCGKTTTLRILAGFEAPESGSVTIEGRDMLRVPTFERPIGLVFQDYALFPHMSVAENIEYGLKRRGVPKNERNGRREEVIDLVRLRGLEARRPAELSGGQQQRVAVARALAPRPALLLLDEPLSNLDARLRHDLRLEMRAILHSAGTTTLMVTHDQEEAITISDRIVLMNAGRAEQVGTPQDLYARPETRFAATFIGRCNWFDGACADGLFRSSDGLAFEIDGDGPRATKVGLAIRPERIRIAGRGANARANRYVANVRAVRFLGSDVGIDLGLDFGVGERVVEAVMKADGRPIPKTGDRVTVEIDRDACVVVADGEPNS